MLRSLRRSCRRRSFFRLIRILLFAFTCLVLCSSGMLIIWESMQRVFSIGDQIDLSLLDHNIPQQCICEDKEASISYNFCYHLPHQTDVPAAGKRFSCEWLPILRQLGLLSLRRDDYFQFDQRTLPEEPPFVCAASASHFQMVSTLITSIHKYFSSPSQRIIFYDLGLRQKEIDHLRQLCNVELRRFPFDRYPTWVKSLMEYRWKPLVIAEALKEFGAIWYFDSSVQLEKGNLSHVYALLNCRHGRGSHHGGTVSPPFIDVDFIESGFHKNFWLQSIDRCDKFAYMLHGFTGHGIFSATNPGVYNYIPTNFTRLKNRSAKMYEAGHVFVVRTVEVVRDALKWYVLCALERDCMAPPNSNLACSFGNDSFGVYANCHRFDQSVINLLLANRNHFDRYFWTSGIVDFFHIVRGGGLLSGETIRPMNCTPSPSPNRV